MDFQMMMTAGCDGKMPDTCNTDYHDINERFPSKLHTMLHEVEMLGLSHIISWQPHGRCFVVFRRKAFVEKVMPMYFRMSVFASFQRQLNMYGFQRITTGSDKGGYYHEMFVRNRRDLVSCICRRKVQGTGVRKPSNPQNEPNFYAMPYQDSVIVSTGSSLAMPHSGVLVLNPSVTLTSQKLACARSVLSAVSKNANPTSSIIEPSAAQQVLLASNDNTLWNTKYRNRSAITAIEGLTLCELLQSHNPHGQRNVMNNTDVMTNRRSSLAFADDTLDMWSGSIEPTSLAPLSHAPSSQTNLDLEASFHRICSTLARLDPQSDTEYQRWDLKN